MAAARIKLGLQEKVKLGHLDSLRDWGHAADYVEAMWLMLQQDKPEDFVLATGVMTTVRDFCLNAFQAAGISLRFEGTGPDEIGIDTATGKTVISVDPRYYRPAEVEELLGDPTKAKTKLGWTHEYDLASMTQEMVESDLRIAKQEMK